MSENEELFKDIGEKIPFYKRAKFWASALLIAFGLGLILLFYKTVIQDTMSDKEVAESIQVVWHDSIWVDKKVRPDEATIVPSFTFKIKNTGSRPLQYIGFNCIFIFEESGENLTDGYVEAVKKPLPPGQVSDEIFVKGFYGYRATSKPAFIKNLANWKPVKVKIYAKTKNSGQVLLGIFPIQKKIEGIRVITEGQEESGS
jgi:archaellum component FlaG (FlaF/FlaG flagellin family)